MPLKLFDAPEATIIRLVPSIFMPEFLLLVNKNFAAVL